MKSRAIVLGITQNWDFAAGVLLSSLSEYLSKEEAAKLEVIIYHSNLSEKQKTLLYKIYPCKFRKYKMSKIKSNKFKRVSKMAFSRFECFKLIKKYDKVLWLDSDALVVNPIREIFMLPDDVDIYMFKHKDIPISVSFSKLHKKYDMKRECYNDGIMLITKGMRESSDKVYNWCYQKTNDYSKYINSDQAIINLAIQEFDMIIGELPVKYNCPPSSVSSNTSIIHPWGTQKFWSGTMNKKWNYYYIKWLKNTKKISIIKYFRYIIQNRINLYTINQI